MLTENLSRNEIKKNHEKTKKSRDKGPMEGI